MGVLGEGLVYPLLIIIIRSNNHTHCILFLGEVVVKPLLVSPSLAGQTLFCGCEEIVWSNSIGGLVFCTFSNYQNGVGASD